MSRPSRSHSTVTRTASRCFFWHPSAAWHSTSSSKPVRAARSSVRASVSVMRISPASAQPHSYTKSCDSMTPTSLRPSGAPHPSALPFSLPSSLPAPPFPPAPSPRPLPPVSSACVAALSALPFPERQSPQENVVGLWSCMFFLLSCFSCCFSCCLSCSLFCRPSQSRSPEDGAASRRTATLFSRICQCEVRRSGS